NEPHRGVSPGQRVISIDAILDVIFSFSTPRTIITLSKTCRAARPIAASYFRVAYKPEYLLRRFLPDPAGVWAFRALQSETGVAIFGRAACNFLARAPLTDVAMGLYVDRSYAAVAGYEVEMREHEFVFFRMGEDEQVAREVVLQVSPPDSFDSVDKPRTLPSELTDVITFDGAYSLFPAQYDEEAVGESAAPSPAKSPLAHLQPTYRSFSDRASWVVTFEHTLTARSHLAFGTSLPARDPLYTSSLSASPPQGQEHAPLERYRDIQLHGVMLRSRLLRFTHIQFLTRLVIAHPGRSNSHFDAEVAQFLRACFGLVDICDGLAPYSAVWAIMKEMAPLPSDTPGAGGLQWPSRTLIASF
ncbi:hypothetical protein BC826DRAFT_1043322, partial [Russula brevipes]